MDGNITGAFDDEGIERSCLFQSLGVVPGLTDLENILLMRTILRVLFLDVKRYVSGNTFAGICKRRQAFPLLGLLEDVAQSKTAAPMIQPPRRWGN